MGGSQTGRERAGSACGRIQRPAVAVRGRRVKLCAAAWGEEFVTRLFMRDVDHGKARAPVRAGARIAHHIFPNGSPSSCTM